ncbi:energy-coupling factor transport system ATP-binding protein [Sporomusaceae bacterium BoRhaA]|uniref:energy-coupling factor ABC transporter ATP-binding protein n=1 Tax=Pelorhabdus rhamnosifermentans TaxID=2772457 RepID=UPI001C062A0E|nr:ABC transporter ATP-binding protein [Pelorhabdus rhamnosifermentans]MBU2700548.1 energy-coupling factor transport system ATP-binding protein [Pelorhabdus rhamnosifermentans]
MNIRLEHFSYAYQKKIILDDINLAMESGSLTVITGLSGCGKTTLCRTLCGLVPHYFGGKAAGQIYFGQKSSLTSSLTEISPQVAIVLEDYESQLFSMTVYDEVAYNLTCPPAKRTAIIEKYLRLVGLEGLSQREVSSLSGGQKQRLAIAGALVKRPQLLVLDEPAAALDPAGTTELYALLSKLCKQGLTVIVSEQDPRELMLLADQVVFLQQGRVACSGKSEEVAAFLEQQEEYREFLPDLWKLRLLIGDLSLPYWKSSGEAKLFLGHYLAGGVEQSA